MRLFCPWNSPGNKHSGPSKPNILRPYLPSAGPLDWESWCVYWIPQSLWRTSLFNYNSSYFWNIGLDYTTSLPLLPISVWFLLYIFSHRFFSEWFQSLCISEVSEVAQSCLTLCNPIDCGLPGSSIHGIFQGRVLGWVAIAFSTGSSRPRDRTQVPCIVGRRFTIWATREAVAL